MSKFSSTLPEKPKSWIEWARQVGLRFFIHFVASHQKIERGPFDEKMF